MIDKICEWLSNHEMVGTALIVSFFATLIGFGVRSLYRGFKDEKLATRNPFEW